MKDYAMLRSILVATAMGLGLVLLGAPGVFGQDVGADVSGGAGIFRPKNPETRKKTGKASDAGNQTGHLDPGHAARYACGNSGQRRSR